MMHIVSIERARRLHQDDLPAETVNRTESEMTVEQIKAAIIRCAASLNAAFSDHNARLLNAHCSKLLEVTGEVYSRGQFVKVGS